MKCSSHGLQNSVLTSPAAAGYGLTLEEKGESKRRSRNEEVHVLQFKLHYSEFSFVYVKVF